MALEKRVVSINFAAGLDQKTDPKLTTKLTTADNVVLRKNGTIEKRPGFIADGTWSVTSNPIRVFPFHQGEFVLTDAATDNASISFDVPAFATPDHRQHCITRLGSSWGGGTSSTAANTKNVYDTVTMRTQNIYGGVESITAWDAVAYGASATQEGKISIVNTGAGGIGNSGSGTLDLDTDIKTFSNAVSANTGQPVMRMVSLGASSTIFGTVRQLSGSATTIVISAGAASGSFGSSETVNPQVDAVAIGGIIYFATKQLSTTGIILGSFNPATSATSQTVIPASLTADILTIATPAPGTDRFTLFWTRNASASTFMASYSLTLSQIQAPTNIGNVGTTILGNSVIRQLAACENTGATQCSLFFTQGSLTVDAVYTGIAGIYSQTATKLDAGTARDFGLRGCTLASKAFLGANGSPYALAQYSVTGQQGLYLINAVGARVMPMARCMFGIAGPNFSTSYNMLPSVSAGTNGRYYSVVRRASYFNALNGSITINYSNELVRINMSQTQPIPYAQVADATFLGGGTLYEFDGESALESGFLSAPLIVTVSTTTTGGSLGAASGSYGVVVVKEFVDQVGRVQLSQPSLPYTFTTSTTTSQATLTFFDPVNFKNRVLRQTQVRYAVFRTTNGNNLYYRDQNLVSTTVVSTTALAVTMTVADTTLAGGDALYTTGGALPNWTPDSLDALYSFKDRLFCNDPTDGGIVRYSKQILPGTGVAFAQSNIILVPGVGRITALGALDSTLVAFRRNSIFVISGDGPDDTGQNGSFSDGQLLFADIGCLDQRSLVRFRDGIAFKSDKGFYLLTRDLQLQYIGADVEDYNSKTVVSSEVVGLAEASGTAEECRFLCSDGTLLTYNYFNGQWTTATLTGCTDAVQTGGRYVVVNASTTAVSARVFQQSLTTYTDDFLYNPSTTAGSAGFYQMTVETGWIKTADVQGFQRIWNFQLVGEAMGAGRVGIEVGYDYESAYNESHTATMSSLTAANYTGGATAIPQTYFTPNRQKCQAIRFRIKDYPESDSTGAVIKLTNISLECGVKGGAFRLPASKGS